MLKLFIHFLSIMQLISIKNQSIFLFKFSSFILFNFMLLQLSHKFNLYFFKISFIKYELKMY